MQRLGSKSRLTLPLLCNYTPPRILQVQRSNIVRLHDPHNDLLERPNLCRPVLDLLLKIRAFVIQPPPLHNRR